MKLKKLVDETVEKKIKEVSTAGGIVGHQSAKAEDEKKTIKKISEHVNRHVVSLAKTRKLRLSEGKMYIVNAKSKMHNVPQYAVVRMEQEDADDLEAQPINVIFHLNGGPTTDPEELRRGGMDFQAAYAEEQSTDRQDSIDALKAILRTFVETQDYHAPKDNPLSAKDEKRLQEAEEWNATFKMFIDRNFQEVLDTLDRRMFDVQPDTDIAERNIRIKYGKVPSEEDIEGGAEAVSMIAKAKQRREKE